jgi:bifunctional pyridoxal-dependent enzyme with beta-cystathionase and maltose regulon repressor activities
MGPSRAAITPRTKMIIVNTPHNPVGKVFTRLELEKIAALAREFNLLVMADEVVRLASSLQPAFRETFCPVRLPCL